jgi:hypothetical protein
MLYFHGKDGNANMLKYDVVCPLCMLFKVKESGHVSLSISVPVMCSVRVLYCLMLRGTCKSFYLTLSSPLIPFVIILLILFFICYNFWGLERVNPFQPQKIVAFFGMEMVNPFLLYVGSAQCAWNNVQRPETDSKEGAV